MSKQVRGLSWKGSEGQDYENFWTGPAKQHLDQLEQLIVSRSLPGGDTIIDIGAGFGRFGVCYVNRYTLVPLVEPANNLREVAAQTYGNDGVRYHDARVYELPFGDSSVDTALMVRVFHHLERPEAALQEIHCVLRPGGRLVFNFSNKRNLKRIAQYLVGRSENPFTLAMESYNATLIGHHPRQIEELLANLGFTVTERYGVGISDKIVGAAP